jgi:hypothetical protein
LFDVVSIGAASAAVVFVLLDLWLTMSFLPLLPEGLIVPAYGITFAVMIAYKLVEKRWDDTEVLPTSVMVVRWRWLRAVTIVVFAAFVVAAVVYGVFGPSQEVPPGQPEMVGGAYYANNHGSLTPLTKAEYEHASRVGLMGFLTVAVLFNLVVTFNMSTAARAKASLVRRPGFGGA